MKISILIDKRDPISVLRKMSCLFDRGLTNIKIEI